uniref:Uncharacterized protein n=1 Tax=Romanomermis culicivorax TaxID=13658 RepID=A0A915JLM5_ROMCU
MKVGPIGILKTMLAAVAAIFPPGVKNGAVMTFLSFFNADCAGSRFKTFGELQTKRQNKILRSDEKSQSENRAQNFFHISKFFPQKISIEGKRCSKRDERKNDKD